MSRNQFIFEEAPIATERRGAAGPQPVEEVIQSLFYDSPPPALSNAPHALRSFQAGGPTATSLFPFLFSLRSPGSSPPAAVSEAGTDAFRSAGGVSSHQHPKATSSRTNTSTSHTRDTSHSSTSTGTSYTSSVAAMGRRDRSTRTGGANMVAPQNLQAMPDEVKSAEDASPAHWFVPKGEGVGGATFSSQPRDARSPTSLVSPILCRTSLSTECRSHGSDIYDVVESCILAAAATEAPPMTGTTSAVPFPEGGVRDARRETPLTPCTREELCGTEGGAFKYRTATPGRRAQPQQRSSKNDDGGSASSLYFSACGADHVSNVATEFPVFSCVGRESSALLRAEEDSLMLRLDEPLQQTGSLLSSSQDKTPAIRINRAGSIRREDGEGGETPRWLGVPSTEPLNECIGGTRYGSESGLSSAAVNKKRRADAEASPTMDPQRQATAMRNAAVVAAERKRQRIVPNFIRRRVAQMEEKEVGPFSLLPFVSTNFVTAGAEETASVGRGAHEQGGGDCSVGYRTGEKRRQSSDSMAQDTTTTMTSATRDGTERLHRPSSLPIRGIVRCARRRAACPAESCERETSSSSTTSGQFSLLRYAMRERYHLLSSTETYCEEEEPAGGGRRCRACRPPPPSPSASTASSARDGVGYRCDHHSYSVCSCSNSDTCTCSCCYDNHSALSSSSSSASSPYPNARHRFRKREKTKEGCGTDVQRRPKHHLGDTIDVSNDDAAGRADENYADSPTSANPPPPFTQCGCNCHLQPQEYVIPYSSSSSSSCCCSCRSSSEAKRRRADRRKKDAKKPTKRIKLVGDGTAASTPRMGEEDATDNALDRQRQSRSTHGTPSRRTLGEWEAKEAQYRQEMNERDARSLDALTAIHDLLHVLVRDGKGQPASPSLREEVEGMVRALAEVHQAIREGTHDSITAISMIREELEKEWLKRMREQETMQASSATTHASPSAASRCDRGCHPISGAASRTSRAVSPPLSWQVVTDGVVKAASMKSFELCATQSVGIQREERRHRREVLAWESEQRMYMRQHFSLLKQMGVPMSVPHIHEDPADSSTPGAQSLSLEEIQHRTFEEERERMRAITLEYCVKEETYQREQLEEEEQSACVLLHRMFAVSSAALRTLTDQQAVMSAAYARQCDQLQQRYRDTESKLRHALSMPTVVLAPSPLENLSAHREGEGKDMDIPVHRLFARAHQEALKAVRAQLWRP